MVEHTIAQLETGIPESLTCKRNCNNRGPESDYILEPRTDNTKDVKLFERGSKML